MASKRISGLKTFCASVKSITRFDVRPSVAYTSKCYHTRELTNVQRFDKNRLRMSVLSSPTASHFSWGSRFDASFSNRMLRNSGFQGSVSFAGINPSINHRLFSSSGSEAKDSIPQATHLTADSGLNGSNGGAGGDDWVEKLKEVVQSSIEALKFTGEKAKEASNEVAPHVQQWLDAHLHLGDVIVPVGGTLTATLLAWFLLPWLFRRFHKYSVQGQGALLAGSSWWGSWRGQGAPLAGSSWWAPGPYEKSFWDALEVPVRYCITFIAFLEIGTMIAPSVIASQHVAQAWKGALVISLFWFLHRWKTNVINRALAAGTIERDHLLTLEQTSSVGLFAVGSMILAEVSGVAMQSILTVGGVGGVATAFAFKDILGNVVSGLNVQNSQQFSIGDTIKVGNEEGEVLKMDLRTTSLVTADGFPVTIPNSLYSTQAIQNKSRAKWCSIVRNIRVRTDDIDKISQIREDITSMLRSNPNVFLENKAPYCILSHIEQGSYAELTLGCNLKQMDKDAEHNILVEAVRVIKQRGDW